MKKKDKFLIMIPYRDRWENLCILLPHLEWYLAKKNFDIVVLEQNDRKAFNKGSLFNAGFSIFETKYDYFVFHDADQLPIEADYSFPRYPTHLGTRLSQYGYKTLFPGHATGVYLAKTSDFRSVNGCSNRYRGWGMEDKDILHRFRTKGVHIEKRHGRYISLPHASPKLPMKTSLENLRHHWRFDYRNLDQDGLTTLKFKVTKRENIKKIFLQNFLFKTEIKLKRPIRRLYIDLL